MFIRGGYLSSRLIIWKFPNVVLSNVLVLCKTNQIVITKGKYFFHRIKLASTVHAIIF